MDQEILAYYRTGDVNKWERVGLVNTGTATMDAVAGTQFYFLGNTKNVPADYVAFPTCYPGYFKNELKECQVCDVGRYSHDQDQLMCTLCPSGDKLGLL